jgi:hypothetical protein
VAAVLLDITSKGRADIMEAMAATVVRTMEDTAILTMAVTEEAMAVIMVAMVAAITAAKIMATVAMAVAVVSVQGAKSATTGGMTRPNAATVSIPSTELIIIVQRTLLQQVLMRIHLGTLILVLRIILRVNSSVSTFTSAMAGRIKFK